LNAKRLLALVPIAAAMVIGLGGQEVGAQAATCDGPGVAPRVQVQSVEDGETIRDPVPGVEFVVTTPDGTEVGRAETDDTGVALICLPERADYVVTLQEDSLPEDMEMNAATEVTLNEGSFATNIRRLNFFSGESGRTSLSFFEKLAQRTVDGIRLGLIIAITSVGLSLIFGTTGLTNFAHGELVTFGALMVYLFSETMGLPLTIGTVLAVAVGGLFGWVLDAGLFARLRGRGMGLVSQMIVTVGLGIFLRNAYLFQFGGDFRFLTAYNNQVAWDFGPVAVTPRDFTITMLSLLVLIAVALVLQKTRIGKATRAVSDNGDLASATGIDTARIIRLVWVAGAALAALGGVFRGLDEGINPDMGTSLLFLMFAGVTLGGLGSAYGALVGGFIVGVLVEVSTLFGVPTELKTVPALVVLVLVLLLRPQGILGQRQRVG
jgi:branched-chain amino acid transport system permease protein